MLEGIRQAGDAQAVVLDVRGNGGGNSLLGYRILMALLTDAITAGATQHSHARAYWRVSAMALEAFEERRTQLLRTEGAGSLVYQFTQQMASLMGDAASRGGDFVQQPQERRVGKECRSRWSADH